MSNSCNKRNLKCPICGSEMEINKVPLGYKWNKGLPKRFTRKPWQYYCCDNCFERWQKKRGDGGFFCFAFVSNKIFTWEASSSEWKDLNPFLNPSKRYNLRENEKWEESMI